MSSDFEAPDPLGNPTSPIRFVGLCVDHPDAARLLRAFYGEQVGRYGFAESVELDPFEYRHPDGAFLIVYLGDEAVGCGGCRWRDRANATAEIKKTYLIPRARGRGIGRTLLAQLEQRAADFGARHVVAETGILNSAALALFDGSGYQRTPSYVAGRDPKLNRAFKKQLRLKP